MPSSQRWQCLHRSRLFCSGDTRQKSIPNGSRDGEDYPLCCGDLSPYRGAGDQPCLFINCGVEKENTVHFVQEPSQVLHSWQHLTTPSYTPNPTNLGQYTTSQPIWGTHRAHFLYTYVHSFATLGYYYCAHIAFCSEWFVHAMKYHDVVASTNYPVVWCHLLQPYRQIAPVVTSASHVA